MKRNMEIAFSALMIVVFAFAVFEARGWQLHARLLPWVIGFPMLALSISQLVLDIRGKDQGRSAAGAKPAERDIPLEVVHHRVIGIVAWLLGLFAAIWLLGFSLSVPLFTFLYLKFESKETWWLALFLSAASWAFLFGLFDRTLHLPFPEGQLFTWLPFE